MQTLRRLLIAVSILALPLLRADQPTRFGGTLFLVDGPGNVVVQPPGIDSDADGLPDDWEATHGLDIANPADAALDIDGDGLSALDEYRRNTDPWDIDTDADWLCDADEPGSGLPPGFPGSDDVENNCELTVFRPSN